MSIQNIGLLGNGSQPEERLPSAKVLQIGEVIADLQNIFRNPQGYNLMSGRVSKKKNVPERYFNQMTTGQVGDDAWCALFEPKIVQRMMSTIAKEQSVFHFGGAGHAVNEATVAATIFHPVTTLALGLLQTYLGISAVTLCEVGKERNLQQGGTDLGLLVDATIAFSKREGGKSTRGYSRLLFELKAPEIADPILFTAPVPTNDIKNLHSELAKYAELFDANYITLFDGKHVLVTHFDGDRVHVWICSWRQFLVVEMVQVLSTWYNDEISASKYDDVLRLQHGALLTKEGPMLLVRQREADGWHYSRDRAALANQQAKMVIF